MLYVFVDESGDLGFTEKSTKYYVIASVETRNLLGLTRVIKKARKTYLSSNLQDLMILYEKAS